jgi:ParB family chromosome partitioning protein
MTMVDVLPLDQIDPNPDQPRKEFDEAALRELADSIIAEGLMQPITVTPRRGRYMIVAGERRWRAHKLAGLATIRAQVQELDDAAVMVQALIENAVRRDVNPLEEAVAYQRCLDLGVTTEDLARRLGIRQVWRIDERLCLLRLRPEYQDLLRKRQIGNSEAYELAQLSPSGQDRLFARIRAGECRTFNELRAASLEIRESERVVDMFAQDADKLTESERRAARSLESRFAQVVKLLRASTVNNEVVAIRKVNPDRAGHLAVLAHEMRAELARIERALATAALAEAA